MLGHTGQPGWHSAAVTLASDLASTPTDVVNFKVLEFMSKQPAKRASNSQADPTDLPLVEKAGAAI